ncbi:MAG: FAD:protein FMN transferase [Candidatus Kaelpia imicola]|nr:FAD:protein FMN transferase [Candidatus Kaelpia imicola]
MFINIAFLAVSLTARAELLFQRGSVMSTYYMIKIEDNRYSYLFDDIARELKRLEGKFSDYSEDSELSYLNNYGGESFLKVSDEMFSVVRDAINIARESGGCFDPTVGPLMELWGFKESKLFLPKEREVQEVLSCLGWENIDISVNNAIRFKNNKVSIDLGGIAKGYAIDSVVDLLRSGGVKNAIVEIGGDIYCLGTGLDGDGWRIGVQDPKKPESVIARIDIKDFAVATSGNYERFLDYKGERFSHIIDPRSGFPVKGDVLSVTVVASRAIDADGWATALVVMGFDKGRKSVESQDNIEAIFISQGEEGYDIWISSGLIDKVEVL